MAVTEMMCGSWVEAVAVLVEMEGRKKDSHFIRFIFLGIGIFLFISTLFHLFASNSSQYKPIIATETFDSTNPLLDEQEKITESYRHHQNKFHSTSRVAVIIPYVGTILPSWFRSFLFTAQLSSHYCDWFIFVTSVINISTPVNVHLIYIDEEELANRIVQMDLSFQSQDSQFWSKKFIELLHLFPYMLVEYKPALGWIFEDYLKGYSHWAFADLDILVGRVSSFLSEEILQQYDVYTSSFGDSNRMYMRGQLTIFRNTYFINNLWRQCPHLSAIITRMDHYFKSEHRMNTKTKGWRFQSAEGCISKVVTDQSNITIYVGSTQISDAFHAAIAEKESMIIGSSLVRCYKSPIDFSEIQSASIFSSSSREYFHNKSTKIFRFESIKDPSCSYWVDPKYQVCLSNNQLTQDLDIIWRGSSDIIGLPVAYDIFRKHGGYCREGMISHFQGWKNSYYGYTTRPPPSNTHFLLLTQTGIIPLLLNSVSIHGFPLPSFQEALKLHYQEKHESLLALQHPYIGTECPGLYCTQYNSNLKNCMSYLSCDDITYFRLGNVNRSKVTLIVIGNEDTVSSGALELTLNSWIGDKTVVIQYDGSISSETMNFIRKITGITSPSFKSFAKHSESQHNEFSNDSQLIGSICIVLVAFSGVDKSSSLLDKTLFNIGMDITMAEMVLLSLPGYIFPLLLDQYLNNLLHVSNSAIIIPALLTNHAGQHYQMSRGNVGRFCGFENQPDSLFLNSSQIFEIRKFQKSFSVGLNSSQDDFFSYIGYQSHMLPIAFNQNLCQHGSNFIRFPMELNGKYCYSTTIYAILKGSGYELSWSPLLASLEITFLQKKRSKSQCESCGLNEEDSSQFLQTLKRYYSRASHLRIHGVRSVHTHDDMGAHY